VVNELRASFCTAAATLYKQQLLCDVPLQAVDGQQIGAHRIILAASSGFFRAMFCGAGQLMREGMQVPHSIQCCAYSSTAVIPLPYTAQQLSFLLSTLYEHQIQVIWRVTSCRLGQQLDWGTYSQCSMVRLPDRQW
jgi:hypothetical protein